MKTTALSLILLVVGLVIGASLVSVVLFDQKSDYDVQVAELNAQKAALEVQNKTQQAEIANLTAQNANLTEALVTPQLLLNYTNTETGVYDFVIASISNQGVLPKYLEINVTPSSGVIISPWHTQYSWLSPGDNFTLSGLQQGTEYLVKSIYTPTPQVPILAYDFIVPTPTGTLSVVRTGPGDFNLTLSSINPPGITSRAFNVMVRGDNALSIEFGGTLTGQYPPHPVEAGDYLTLSGLTLNQTYEVRIEYGPTGGLIASTTIVAS